jgi:hypothetical protein
MTPRGFEPSDASTLPINDLQQSLQSSAAQSGAIGAEAPSRSDLEALAAALLSLSPTDRARLAALLIDKPTQQP